VTEECGAVRGPLLTRLVALVVALRVLLLDADRFLADLGLGGALLLEPLGKLGLQRLDLLRGESLRDTAAREPRDGDAQLRRDDRTGVRAVASQVLQPLGGSACSAVSSARDDTLLELAGVASRYTPSFLAAVAGFIVWVFWCDVMVSRVSSM
jgi:hypothetical protein